MVPGWSGRTYPVQQQFPGHQKVKERAHCQLWTRTITRDFLLLFLLRGGGDCNNSLSNSNNSTIEKTNKPQIHWCFTHSPVACQCLNFVYISFYLTLNVYIFLHLGKYFLYKKKKKVISLQHIHSKSCFSDKCSMQLNVSTLQFL